MDKETKQEMILESFDILKDSWENKRESIERLIFKMFSIDKDIAIDMWLYILRKNEDDFGDKEYTYKSSYLTTWVVSDLIYGPECGCYITDYNNPNEIALAEIFTKNKELCSFIFGKSLSVSWHTSYVLSHIIASCDSETLLQVLQMITENKKEQSLGTILTKAIEHIPGHYVPKSQIDLLEDFVASISDKTERAEAFTALLSIAD